MEKRITHMIRDRVNDEAFYTYTQIHDSSIHFFFFSFFRFQAILFLRARYVFIRSDDYIYVINLGVWWCVKYLIS